MRSILPNEARFDRLTIVFLMALIMIANAWEPGPDPLDKATDNTVVDLIGSVLVILIPDKDKTKARQVKQGSDLTGGRTLPVPPQV
ncbi:hypothetical protein JNB88_29320 [Rhizobium cauense]|uniref:hypothetical protein n=1 Tax=Rhizobium cauense TaxID=1166683 RepID=UPI001C6EC89D|nr:hypothetical protein [Rhizobium cauense]MBW9117722.1 hypothetical protein [Rhizobium cauense]